MMNRVVDTVLILLFINVLLFLSYAGISLYIHAFKIWGLL